MDLPLLIFLDFGTYVTGTDYFEIELWLESSLCGAKLLFIRTEHLFLLAKSVIRLCRIIHEEFYAGRDLLKKSNQGGFNSQSH